MTVKWGSVEVPELEYRPHYSDPALRHPEPGLVHLPTGLRLDEAKDARIDRNQWSEWTLFAPPGEDWSARIIIFDTYPTMFFSVPKHYGYTRREFTELSVERRRELDNEYLRTVGREITCGSIKPEPGSPSAKWTTERRDALILMLSYLFESPPGHPGREPLPTFFHFRPEGVPEEFHGSFRNPVWERMS